MQSFTRRRGLTRPARAAHRDTPVRPASTLARGGARAPVLDARAILEFQRLAGNASARELVAPAPAVERSPVLDVIRSGRGQPLDDSTRTFMEKRFGRDFGRVRIHRDAAATASARSINAHAYTAGNDIVFQSRLYNPHSTPGRRMLAHELAHVVQQRLGSPAGTPVPGGIEVTEPGDTFERQADRIAREIASPDGGSIGGPTTRLNTGSAA